MPVCGNCLPNQLPVLKLCPPNDEYDTLFTDITIRISGITSAVCVIDEPMIMKHSYNAVPGFVFLRATAAAAAAEMRICIPLTARTRKAPTVNTTAIHSTSAFARAEISRLLSPMPNNLVIRSFPNSLCCLRPRESNNLRAARLRPKQPRR